MCVPFRQWERVGHDFIRMILVQRIFHIFFFERNINIEEEAIKTESLSRETPLDTTVFFQTIQTSHQTLRCLHYCQIKEFMVTTCNMNWGLYCNFLIEMCRVCSALSSWLQLATIFFELMYKHQPLDLILLFCIAGV